MSQQADCSGTVSVFMGLVPDRNWFDDYLRESQNPDDGEIRCAFWDDLGVTWLDHDCQDAHYQGDTPVATSEFLQSPFSYIESFRSLVLDNSRRLGLESVNCGIFVYNYSYPSDRQFPSPYLMFIGSFEYTGSSPEWFRDLIDRS